jgi:hypothetical protein
MRGVAMRSRRRAYPYYKVQILDGRSLTWIERKQGFDTLADAKQYVDEFLTGKQTRIVSVDERGYHVLED